MRFASVEDQSVGSLMSQALGDADKALLIDPSVPGIQQGLLRRALDQVDECDLVVGPTRKGACYLIGIDRGKASALTGLENGLPLSEDAVDAFARETGLSVRKLPELQCCESVEDYRHFYACGLLG